MKLLILFCGVVAVFSAPVPDEAPKEFELTQTSDIDGTYSYTFATEDHSKTEARTLEGAVRGAYSYIDSDGVLQKVQYIADENGFQAYGTNLPIGSTVPVKETAEVLEATAQHFALVDEHVKKVALHEKLHEEFKKLHPELFEEETAPATRKVLAPVAKKAVQPVVKKAKGVVLKTVEKKLLDAPDVSRHGKVSPVSKKVSVVNHAAPITKTVVRHVSFHGDEPVVRQFVRPERRHGHQSEDDDVKAERAAHLAIVEKLTSEHLAALAAAPK